MENQAKTTKPKHSFLVSVKKGKKLLEHVFETKISTIRGVKKDLDGWFYATHQRVEIISVKKLN